MTIRSTHTRADYGNGLGFCGGRISGLILSSCADNCDEEGEGNGLVRTTFGFGGTFIARSIQFTLSRISMMVSLCDSSLREIACVLDSASPILCSKKIRVSAMRSSRTASFRSKGVRKLRISWICLRISSNVFCILIYKNDSPRPLLVSLFRSSQAYVMTSKSQINIWGSAICNAYGSREDREVREGF